MKKLSLFIACFSILWTASLQALASNQYSVRITQVGTFQPNTGSTATHGYGYILVETPRSSYPACTTQPLRWIINNTDPEVTKMQMSQLMFAMSQGRPVNIYGTGDCNVSGSTWNTFEVINYLEVN